MEEARFVVRTEITREGCRALNRVHSRKSKMILWVCTAICMIGAIYGWWLASISGDIGFAIELSLMAVFVLALRLFQDRVNSWIIYRGRNRNAGATECRFCEDAMLIKSALEESRINYSAFMRIVEERNYFFLYVQKRVAHVIPKTDFTAGDPAEFGAFISEKTGLTVERVRG